jgi:general secretion pathway protein K
VLLTDNRRSKDSDHISEGWLNKPIDFANEQVMLRGELEDLEGRFNLNWLRDSQPQGADGTRYSVQQQRFIRLLQTLPLAQPLDVIAAEEVTNAVRDWLDEDPSGLEVERVPGGAEALYYAELTPPYRPANRPFVSVSELRLVRGVSAELYRALLPHISVWGEAININTASAALLRSLNKNGVLLPLSEAQVAPWLGNQQRDKSAYASVNEALAAVNVEQIDSAGLAVNSRFFLLTSVAALGQSQFALSSVLQRDDNKVTVIARSQWGL